ncbi:MAG TPA: flagellar export protein FliJ [Deltaproteobacteria bacterium]|nr:flagellar export protein FliJ [Deltaproteobacteria bacterium]
MAFRFRFQTLLKVRRIQEDLARQAFAQAQKQLAAISAMEDQVRAHRELAAARLVTGLSDGMPALEVRRFYEYLSHLDDSLARLKEAFDKAERLLEERRSGLVEARKAHRIMQRLREIHLGRHVFAEDRREMNFIDEIAVTKAGGER